MDYAALLLAFLSLISISYGTPLTLEELQDIRSQCPRINGRNPIYIPHPADCTEFFVCDNGRPKAMNCPDDLHFNPKSRVCDWVNRAGCTARDDFRIRVRPGQRSKKVQQLMKKDIRCPLRNRERPVFLEHEENCGQYYVCDHGLAIWMTCPRELHFNIQKSICDYQAAVRCKEGRRGERAPAAPELGYSAPAVPEIEAQVPNNIGEKDVRCPRSNGDRPIFLKHERDCGRYYVCDNGIPIEMDCPHHLHFNTDKNVCDQPENAKCETEEVEEKEEEEKVNENEDKNDVEYPDSEDTLANYAMAASPRISKEDPRCPRQNGMTLNFLPHETDCGKYYVCDWGNAILMHCPPSVGFDPEKNVCSIGRPC